MPKLTKTEAEIYDLWIGNDLSATDIASSRGTKLSIVYRHLRNLKKKGYDKSIKIKRTVKEGHISSQPKKVWRYHALHFVLTPYHPYPRYKKNIGTFNAKWYDWKVDVHEKVINIQLRANHNFRHQDKWQCISLARESLNKLLFMISNRYGFEYEKDGRTSIKCVNHHLARSNSEVAQSRKGEYLTVHGKDGKIWFSIDKSEFEEHEYRHPKNAISDSEIVEPYFNDWLNNQPMTNTQLQARLSESVTALHNLTVVEQRLAKNIEKHIELVKSSVEILKMGKQKIMKDQIRTKEIQEQKDLTRYIQ